MNETLLGVKQTKTGEEEVGSGIQKRSKRQKTAKEKRKKRKEYREKAKRALIERLGQVEKEKLRFTEKKSLLNRLLQLPTTSNEELVPLLDEARTLYRTVIALYDTLFQERLVQEAARKEALAEAEERYEKTKRRLIEVRKEREQQDAAGKRIVARYTTFLNEPDVLKPPERKKPDRLSREERAYLKKQAAFYNELYKEASADVEAEIKLKERIESLTEKRAHLKAKKQLVQEEKEEERQEEKRLRAQLSTFTGRNAYVEKSLDELRRGRNTTIIIAEEQEEEEAGEGLSLLDMALEEAEGVEEDDSLSETTESDQLVLQMNDIRERLVDANYTSLSLQYNKPYQALFLEPLIEMYRNNDKTRISQEAMDLVAYLVDTRGETMATLYEMLWNETSLEALLAYVSQVIAHNKVERLWRDSAKLHTPIALMRRINAFLYDEDEGEDEESENPPLIQREVSAEERLVEERKAVVHFAPYQFLEPEPIQGAYSCVYRALLRQEDDKALSIKIIPVDDQESSQPQVHQLLADTPGFAKLVELFRLEHFPHTLFPPCAYAKRRGLYEPVTISITEYVPFAYHDAVVNFDDNDRFSALFELLIALETAKKLYGIQHNNVSLRNLRFNSVYSMRRYRLATDQEVFSTSQYRVTLIDFGHASFDLEMAPQRRFLLENDDFNSFYRLATRPDMHISDSLTNTLRRVMPSKPGAIEFDALKILLHSEIDK